MMLKNFKLRSSALLCSLMVAASLSAAPVEMLGIWESPTVAPDEGSYIFDAAPKGGTLRMGGMGTFDSFNPFAPRGVPAAVIPLTYETLGESIGNEDFIMRGKIAKTFDVADDRLSMIVTLNELAKFSDGKPITAKDVVWSFEHLIKEASPTYRNYYREVTGAKALDEKRVQFTFADAKNRELPMIITQMPVLPSHWWKGKKLGDPQKSPMPGSGPYVYESWNMGSRVTLKRNPNWWGNALPQNKGRYNFDKIDVEYFRDFTVMRQAFFAGNIDFFSERTIKDWKMGYDVPPVNEGKIKRAEVPFDGVWGMSGVFMNTRHPILADIRVRKALALMFNFERVNKTIFFDSYNRIEGFWSGSHTMAARDTMTETEEKILASLPGIDPAKYQTLPKAMKHKATSTSRSAMRQAMKLLNEAGWTMQGDVMKNAKGEPLHLSMILQTPTMVRVFSGWSQDLKRIGVNLELQSLDQTQYINRIRNFDYDLTLSVVRQSNNPGNEQRYFFGSQAADQANTRNFAGIKSPAVDELIENIAAPESRDHQVASVRVLDRILQNDYYVIPGWYSQTGRIAWWDERIVPPNGKIPEGRRIDIFSWHAAELDGKAAK